MPSGNPDIITNLQKEILLLQGFKPVPQGTPNDLGLGPIKYAFPNACFPVGSIHEFSCQAIETQAATSGFISSLLGKLMHKGAACIWISSSRTLFPAGLPFFGIPPERIVFIDLKNERDMLWTMEEALKCNGLAAVVGELRNLSFTASRRLQLAVEQSRVTGFVIRQHARELNTTACIARWRISSIPGEEIALPGLSHPHWKVELLKVRNGRPGSWKVKWINGRLQQLYQETAIIRKLQQKTG